MISFQLCSFWLGEMPRVVTWSEIEEDLTIGSINPSSTKNNKLYYVIASLREAISSNLEMIVCRKPLDCFVALKRHSQ